MSLEYCADCDKMIDLDYNSEHFDEEEKCIISKKKLPYANKYEGEEMQ